MKTASLLTVLLLLAAPLTAQVPNLIPHQGRVAVNGVNFDGTGQFKFALVNAAGTTTYWSNNGSSTAGSQPTAAVSLPVTKGLYSVMLGDTSLANMTAVPASVYANADLRLRVWFNNGTLGFQQLTPDQRLAPNGYLPDGAVTSAKLAPGATPPFVQVSGTSQNVVANTNYIATSSGTTAFNLPATAAIGDVVSISGSGAGPSTVTNPDGWTRRPVETQGEALLSVACSADGMKLITAGNQTRLYISTDAGATWTERETKRNWSAVACSADGSRLIAAEDNGRLYLSADSGINWEPRGPQKHWNCIASSADGSRLIAGTANERLYTSSDFGLTWVARGDFDVWSSVACSADGSRLIACGGVKLHTSSDYGVTWVWRMQPSYTWRAVASSSDGQRLVVTPSLGPVFTSSDSGVTWTARGFDRGMSCLASSADGTRLIGCSSRLYVSSDAGVTWSPRELNRGWSSVASSADGTHLAATVGYSQPGLYTSTETVPLTAGESANFIYGNSGWVQSYSGLWTVTGDNIYRAKGNVGIGTASPKYPLSFGANGANTLLALYDHPNYPGASYGLGVGDNQFRLHLGGIGARFSFLNESAGTEVMTVKGNGRVGIGVIDPVSALHVNGVITGDGSGLTSLNAASLTGSIPAASLTSLPAAGLTGSVPAASLTSVPAGSLTGSVPAAALTSVPAGSLTGTIDATRLPSTVALRSSANTFLGAQTIATGGNFTQPQLLLSQTTANDWSRLRMQAVGGPAWDIALCPGATPTMNFYNGSANVLALEQDGDAVLTKNLNFSAGTLRQMLDLWNGEHGIGVQSWTTYFRTNGAAPGAFAWYKGGTHNDAQYNPGGGVELMRLDSAGLSVRGTFVSSSDRNRKENIQPVNAREILEKVAALPVSRWNYKDDADTPHIGPMAQDFHAAFGAGADDKHIAMVDADGVALAAIQGLNQKLSAAVEEKDAEIAALKKQNAAMEARLASIEALLARPAAANAGR